MTGSLWPASLDYWVILQQLETLYQKKKKVSCVQGTTPKLVLSHVHACDVLIYKMKKKKETCTVFSQLTPTNSNWSLLGDGA